MIFATDDDDGKNYAFIEMTASRDSYFVQEPILLQVRIVYDTNFFETNVIELFRQRLDVQVQAQAPWIRNLPGAIPLDEDNEKTGNGTEGEFLSFVLNDNVARAVRKENRIVDNRVFTVMEFERRFLPSRPGELVIPSPVLRFAYTQSFEKDFINGRVAAKRREALVEGKEIKLTVHALPDDERPLEFTGAVGVFSIKAVAEPLDLKVGEILKLKLYIEGQGNLEFFEPPRLEMFEGIHVYGMIEESSGNTRSFTYDLTPLNESVSAIPPIKFAFFDTQTRVGFRTVTTKPILLDVRPLPDGVVLKPLPGLETRRMIPGENDIFEIKHSGDLSSMGANLRLNPLLVAGVIIPPWILAIGLLYWLRRRERDINDPDGVRARNAASSFRASITEHGADIADLYAEFLAASLRCPPAAVITLDLCAKLKNAGVPDSVAANASTMLQDMISARYSNDKSGFDAQKISNMVEELEIVFQANRRTK